MIQNQKNKHISCLPIAFLLFALLSCSETEKDLDSLVKEVPNPKTSRNSWIEDSAGILTNTSSIDSLISENEAATGVEIAVVILPTIESYVPKDFAVALFNHWGIGKKGKDNGILVLHIIDQRRVEIETGYGIEGDLPDVVVKRIIDTYTIPAFKAGDFSRGHLETVTAIINKLNHPELEVTDLVTSGSADINLSTANEETSLPIERTDHYDYQGKRFSQLTELEKQKLDETIKKYNVTSNYFLTDEESKLLEERSAEQEETARKNSISIRMKIGAGYLLLLLAFFLIQQMLYWLIPSPDFKYSILRNTDFPIFYGTLILPIFLSVLVFSHFWGEESIFFTFFISIASFVLYNLFWGDRRLDRLSKRLLKVRSIPRKCPECKTLMTKLSEQADNAYLSKGQIAEEILKSIDYDVWICQACNANEILPFHNIDPEYIFKGTSFKKIKKCPECEFLTFAVSSSKITSAATYSSSGSVEVVRVCKHCQHKAIETETIPKKQKSSSGSGSSGGGGGGGSFGGGSSGGGGSGGSY